MSGQPDPPIRDAVARLLPSKARLPRTSWEVAPAAALHLNESPWPPSPRVIEAIRTHAHLVNRYPEPQPAELMNALSRAAGIAPDRIVLGAGSDELIQVIASVFLEDGTDAVMPAPAFPKYRHAALVAGARPVEVALAEDGACDGDAMLAEVGDSTRLLFVATPNSPTGGAMAADSLRRLAARIPASAVLVVDEAYHEFARESGAEDLLPILQASSCHWVVLRTFSKAYALAGLRVGYALTGSTALADALLRVRPVFAPSYIAGVAALAALADSSYAASLVERICVQRRLLEQRLRQIGLDVLPSAANFLAVDTARDARTVIERLASGGIHVAPIPGRGYENFVRITIGTPNQNEAVASALGQIAREKRPAEAAMEE